MIFLPANPASFTHKFCSEMQSFYFNESQDATVLQICHEKWCSGLVKLQLGPLIWEIVSPRTHKTKNESLKLMFFLSLKILFISGNSSDPDEMLPYVV